MYIFTEKRKGENFMDIKFGKNTIGVLTLFVILLLGFTSSQTATVSQNLFGILEGPSFLGLEVYSPVDSGIYAQRRIQFNLTTVNKSEIIEYINYNDNNPRFSRLCRDCNSYGFFRKRLERVNEGMNNITFRAIDNLDNPETEDVSFIVDTKDPKITKTEPRRNDLANGSFILEFNEENPIEILLFYGDNNTQVDLGDCSLEREKYSCSIFVNLSEYENQEIEYYFTVKDIINQTDMSRPVEVRVDDSLPILNDFDISFQESVFWRFSRVTFYFDIAEQNFDEITYIDHEERNPREKVLCSRLRNGICRETRYFSKGEHNLTIEIKDEVGHSVKIEPVEFTI
jgi:hypothetical protein